MANEKSSQRLRGVVRVQERDVDAAARALGAVNQRLERQRYSQQLLGEARTTQLERADSALGSGSYGLHLKFMGHAVENLERGLTQISQSIATIEQERDERAAELAAARQRQEALGRLVEQRKTAEEASVERGTQNAMDDIAASRVQRQQRR